MFLQHGLMICYYQCTVGVLTEQGEHVDEVASIYTVVGLLECTCADPRRSQVDKLIKTCTFRDSKIAPGRESL